jgi:hypothetical protein
VSIGLGQLALAGRPLIRPSCGELLGGRGLARRLPFLAFCLLALVLLTRSLSRGGAEHFGALRTSFLASFVASILESRLAQRLASCAQRVSRPAAFLLSLPGVRGPGLGGLATKPGSSLGALIRVALVRTPVRADPLENEDSPIRLAFGRLPFGPPLGPNPLAERLPAEAGRFQRGLELPALPAGLFPTRLLAGALALLFLAAGERLLAALFLALPLPLHLAL